MTTTTETGTITAPAPTLRAILAALDHFTTDDRTRVHLTLARLTPVIVEQTAKDETRPTAIRWEATDSYALIEITGTTEHTLTEPALIDPAAILAALPKKQDGPATLTITGPEWTLSTGTTTAAGRTENAADFPTTLGLWQHQQTTIAPHTMGAWQYERLAKAAKIIGGRDAAIEMASMRTGENITGPVVHHIRNPHNLTVRTLLMPQR